MELTDVIILFDLRINMRCLNANIVYPKKITKELFYFMLNNG